MNSLPPTYDDEDISTEPFVNAPQFSRGLWKHPVKFVAASTPDSTPKSTAPKPLSIADQYLAIVFPNGEPKPEIAHPICPTCNEPMTQADERAHFLSLGHQMALPRGPTPSAIDRTRMGLKYMEKYGFNVDERKGLGVTGEGRLYPIVPKEKNNTYGLGVVEAERKKAEIEAKKQSLDAGKAKSKVAEEKKKAEKLQRMFYGDDNVEQYLQELDEHSASAKTMSLGGFRVTKRGKRR